MNSDSSHSRLEDSTPMERETIRIEREMREKVDALVEASEYPNKSQAYRDLLWRGLEARENDE